jgi:hypothetical protein
MAKTLCEVIAKRPLEREAVDRHKRQTLACVIARQLHLLRDERSDRHTTVPS